MHQWQRSVISLTEKSSSWCESFQRLEDELLWRILSYWAWQHRYHRGWGGWGLGWVTRGRRKRLFHRSPAVCGSEKQAEGAQSGRPLVSAWRTLDRVTLDRVTLDRATPAGTPTILCFLDISLGHPGRCHRFMMISSFLRGPNLNWRLWFMQNGVLPELLLGAWF